MSAALDHAASIRQVNLTDAGEISRIEGFVAEHGGSVFQRPAWLAAIAQGTANPAFGLILERAGMPMAWLPLTLVHSPFFGRTLVSSGFGVHGGVLAHCENDAHALCHGAEELAARLSATSIELRSRVAPGHWDKVSGKHANFTSELACNDDTQLLAIPRKARAEVRKGLATDLSISVGNASADQNAHFQVYAQSVRNLGTPVFPRDLFSAVLDRFGDAADIMTVRYAGTPVASVLSLYHDNAVMPFWGGGTFAARKLRANERMYFELMRHARARGCSRFDFGRSKIGSGAYAFKKNWGFEAEPLVYRCWTVPGATGRNIDPTDQGFARKIALWQKLPVPLTNMLGPWIARGLG